MKKYFIILLMAALLFGCVSKPNPPEVIDQLEEIESVDVESAEPETSEVETTETESTETEFPEVVENLIIVGTSKINIEELETDYSQDYSFSPPEWLWKGGSWSNSVNRNAFFISNNEFVLLYGEDYKGFDYTHIKGVEITESFPTDNEYIITLTFDDIVWEMILTRISTSTFYFSQLENGVYINHLDLYSRDR